MEFIVFEKKINMRYTLFIFLFDNFSCFLEVLKSPKLFSVRCEGHEKCWNHLDRWKSQRWCYYVRCEITCQVWVWGCK